MKLIFSITVRGNESLKKKFEEQAEYNSDSLQICLMKGFAKTIVSTLNVTVEDDLAVTEFKAFEIPDDDLKK